VDVVELAAEVHDVVGPGPLVDLDALLGAAASLTERNAQRVELLPHPPCTHSEQ